MESKDQWYEKLKLSLFEELDKYNLDLMPDSLVRVSAKLLVNMYYGLTSFRMMEIVGYGSIWAWSFDSISDDPTIDFKDKEPFLNEFIHLIDNQDLAKPIKPAPPLPITAPLIIDCINGLVEYRKLDSFAKKLIKAEYINCMQGAYYEVKNMAKKVPNEESLLYRGYSYATPFYGALVLAGDFKISNDKELETYQKFLKLVGRVTRIKNDIATYYKEKDADEINLPYVLIRNGYDEQLVLDKSERMLKDSLRQYGEMSKELKEKKFVEICDNFILVHNSAYEIKNIRELDADNF